MYFLTTHKFVSIFWFDKLSKNNCIFIRGTFGISFFKFSFNYYFPYFVSNKSIFFFSSHKKFCNSFFSNTSNIFFGVSSGYFRYIELKGIGFKAIYSNLNHCLYFFLGYNHAIIYKISDSVQVKVRKNYILIFSFDKIILSNVCCQIKSLRFPDPYRGKGVLFKDEYIKFKASKQR